MPSRLPASVLLALLVLLAPHSARAFNTKPEFVAGLSLGSIGAAGAIVSGIGCFAYIAHREHAGGWGWLSLLSGIPTITGGILMANNDRLAKPMGAVLIGFGILSISTGIVGLSLQTPEAKREWRKRRRRVQWGPLLLASPTGDQVPALGVYGVF